MDALIVQARSIQASEVYQRDDLVRDLNTGVLTRQRGVRNNDVIARYPTDRDGAGERKRLLGPILEPPAQTCFYHGPPTANADLGAILVFSFAEGTEHSKP